MVAIMSGRPASKLLKKLLVSSIKSDSQGQGQSLPLCAAILGMKCYFPVTLTHTSSCCFNLRFLITANSFSRLALELVETLRGLLLVLPEAVEVSKTVEQLCVCVYGSLDFKTLSMHVNVTVLSEVVIKQHKSLLF